jgi:hypothetical protein
MGPERRSFRTALSCLVAMATAISRGSHASPPPGVTGLTFARTLTDAVDRLLVEGMLKERALRLWKESGCGFLRTEHAAWIVASDEPGLSFVSWPHRGFVGKEVWRGPVPPNVIAIIHTHPDDVDPRPSARDAATARRFGISNYTVSRRGIWKTTPDGRTVQVDGEEWFARLPKPG